MLKHHPDNKSRYEFDESIFTPNEERVKLPSPVEEVYHEQQAFDQIWLWAILGIELLVILIPLVLTGQPWWTFVLGVGVMVMTMALLGSMKLTTSIDSTGVQYKMSVFHWKTHTIPWEDIDQIYVRKYAPISEYGGWGIRYGRGGRALNVRGNYGIQIVKKDGKRLLLGTQTPEEAALYLSKHPLLV